MSDNGIEFNDRFVRVNKIAEMFDVHPKQVGRLPGLKLVNLSPGVRGAWMSEIQRFAAEATARAA